MKEVVSISLGDSKYDYEFETEFLGNRYVIRRFGTDGDIDQAANLLLKWNNNADAIGIGHVKFPSPIDSYNHPKKHAIQLKHIATQLNTPVTTGEKLRSVLEEWAIRYIQFKWNHYFTNAISLFLSGITQYRMAKVLNEFTDNLSFADPVLEHQIPKCIHTIKDLEKYAKGIHNILKWIPGKFLRSKIPITTLNDYTLKKAMQKATIIIVPTYDFYKSLETCTVDELGGKTVITSTVYDDRIQFLKDRGVSVIIDVVPKIFERVVGINVLEAIILASLGKHTEEITDDDLLEIISDYKMDPRVIYPTGTPKRVNRFAFVIHPLSQEYFKKVKPLEILSKATPPVFMDTMEKIIAYAPPFVYSKVTGIKSPQGVEAEGWLISVGGTPKEMMAHDPEFTYKRLLQAAKMAKRLGAQIMGLGAFTKVVGDSGATVSRRADIPVTTGNSYSASAALWAAADAVRRMGLIKIEKGKKIKGKTMVFGATGAIGSVCCRLLAKAFEEVYMVGRNTAKLLALKESILEETPDVMVYVATNPDKYLKDMDVIVTATSGAGKKQILDIMKVKPGCVITDVARPLDIPPEDVAKRPDVLVIESGEIYLPGNVDMKNIGLPKNVAYACLAETIVLALEGRFEPYTVGRDIEWQKVREIYKMGLKHGMTLAAISGVNGVFTDEDIARVKELALKEREKLQINSNNNL